MPANAVVIHGNIKSDGTLELDGKVPLPAGKVQVTLQPVPELPEGDPFFDMLRSIWAARQQAGLQPRSVEEIEAERRRFRDEVDEEIAEAGRLQEECWRMRKEAEQASKEAP